MWKYLYGALGADVPAPPPCPPRYATAPWTRTWVISSGASPGFGRGGGQELFFSDLGICMSLRGMLRMAKPSALLRGFGGMLLQEIFFKRCNLVRLRVYFDQILSLFFSKNYHFLYKK